MASIPQHPARAIHSGALAPMQMGILVVYGAALWFGVALIMRFVGPIGAFEGMGVVLLYALIVPCTVAFIYVMRRLAQVRGDQTAIGVAVVIATASLLDGVALSAFPALYGGYVAGAGAAILWGVGIGLVWGVIMNRLVAG